MEVGILTSQLQSFIPDERVDTKVRLEVELDVVQLALVIRQSVCLQHYQHALKMKRTAVTYVDTKTLHHSVGARDTTIRLCL